MGISNILGISEGKVHFSLPKTLLEKLRVGEVILVSN